MLRIVGLILVTVLAAGVGAYEGQAVHKLAVSALEQDRKQEPAAPPPRPKSNVRELKPMVTNLAAPPNTWVRLEAAIVTEAPEPDGDKLAGEIATDSIAYLRTLTVADLEGAEGLRRLRDDLGERAALRSGKRVREVIIETLVVQ